MKTTAEVRQLALLGAENAANMLRSGNQSILSLVAAETQLRVAHACALRLVERAKGNPEPQEGK